MNEVPTRKLNSKLSLRVLSRISPEQWWIGGTSIVLILVLVVIPLWPTRIAAILVLIAAVLLVWPRSYGPGYTYPAEAIDTLKIRRREGRVAQDERPGKKGEVKYKEPLPAKIVPFPTTAPGRESLGVFHFTDTNADSTFVVGEAWQRGVNVGFAERFSAENDLADAILDASNMTAGSVGIFIGAYRGPVDIWESRDWNGANLHSNVLSAGRSDFDERPPDNVHERQHVFFDQLDKSRQLQTRKVQGFVGLNVARTKEFEKIAQAYREGAITTKKFENQVMISRMTRRLQENLRIQGLTGVRAFDEIEARDYAKRAVSVDLEEWDYLRRHPDDMSKPGMTPTDRLWPWGIEEPLVLRDSQGNPYIRFDNTFCRVARAIRLNETVFPGEFRPLFDANDIGLANETSLMVSMSGRTYSARDESRALTYAILLQRAIGGIFRPDDMYMSAEEEAEANKLRERQNDLYFGGAQALGFNLFMTWSAKDEDGLFEADRAVDEHARSCGIKLEYIPLESRQIPAYFSAHFGGFLL